MCANPPKPLQPQPSPRRYRLGSRIPSRAVQAWYNKVLCARVRSPGIVVPYLTLALQVPAPHRRCRLPAETHLIFPLKHSHLPSETFPHSCGQWARALVPCRRSKPTAQPPHSRRAAAAQPPQPDANPAHPSANPAHFRRARRYKKLDRKLRFFNSRGQLYARMARPAPRPAPRLQTP